MTHRVLGLLLAVVLLSVPLTAQTPWQPPRTPDGQPDMQGIWRNGTFGMVAAAITLESDHSRWQAEFIVQNIPRPTTPVPSYIIDPPDGKIPYQPWAAAKRQEFIANVLAPTKLEHVDSYSRALLVGVPRTNHLPGAIQILQVPGYVVMLYEANHAYRLVPLDKRSHIGENIKLFNGDSRGHWEGSTLVVDVTNQDARTWLDAISFHGEGLHVVERWTLVGPDRVDYEVTFEDPSMFTRPWKVAYHFNRDKTEGFEIWEQAWHEGERDVERTLRGGGLAGRRKE